MNLFKKKFKRFGIKAGLIIALVVAGLVAVLFLPQQNRARGIDVSRWQGRINWNKVAQSNIKFAFIKASEGLDYVDPMFERNFKNASACGVIVGVYHYAQPGGKNLGKLGITINALTQALQFVNVAEKAMQNGNLRPALDLEVNPQNMDKAQLSYWANTFIDSVHNLTGVKPLVYTYAWFAFAQLDGSLAKRDLWFARYNNQDAQTSSPDDTKYHLGPWKKWAFWQYSSTGTVPGIKGNVDLDVSHGNMSFLSKFIVNK